MRAAAPSIPKATRSYNPDLENWHERMNAEARGMEKRRVGRPAANGAPRVTTSITLSLAAYETLTKLALETGLGRGATMDRLLLQSVAGATPAKPVEPGPKKGKPSKK